MRLTVGDSTLRMFQNCSPSRARLVNDLLESETKNSDRLSSLGCSRAMSDIIVEPQRPVLTMKTGGSMRALVVALREAGVLGLGSGDRSGNPPPQEKLSRPNLQAPSTRPPVVQSLSSQAMTSSGEVKIAPAGRSKAGVGLRTRMTGRPSARAAAILP